MVCIVSLHYYTDDLGAGGGAYVLQCHGIAEVLGRNTWSCELEKCRLLFLFNSGDGGIREEYREYHTRGNSSLEIPVCSNFSQNSRYSTHLSVSRGLEYP